MSEAWMEDARKIPDDVMNYIRNLAVRAIVEEGISPETVAEVFHMSRTAIYRWLKLFDQGGYPELETKKAPGSPPEITEEMDDWLKDTVLNYRPEDFGYDTALWTRDILAEILNAEFSIDVGGRAVGYHLQKIGLSYQKPWFRSREQDNAKVRKFLEETFPRIQNLAQKIGADIAFEDEAGIGLQTHSGKTWGEVGHTPEVAVTGKRGGYNLLSMVTPDGEMRFSIKNGKLNSDTFIEFLKSVMKDRSRPLILIADRASFHASKQVREFVRSNRKKIRIYFLPPYSPELNPDEQVWNTLKDKNLGRAALKNKQDLKKKAYSVMYRLQKSVVMIESFFKLPHTLYAGAT
jgi:transposase